MELKLHAERYKKVLLKGIDVGLVSLAHIKRDKVPLTVVPRVTTCGDRRMWGFPGGGKCRARFHLVGASPR